MALNVASMGVGSAVAKPILIKTGSKILAGAGGGVVGGGLAGGGQVAIGDATQGQLSSPKTYAKAIGKGAALGGVLGAGAGALSRGAARVKLFRGVPKDHPKFGEAQKGAATPFGGHEDPKLHNTMDTHSEFTSWTTDIEVAKKFAGEGGVILEKNVPVSRTVKSPDAYGEKEVLIRGPVRGAKVTKNE